MYDTKTKKNVCTFCKKELVDGEILKYRMEYPQGGKSTVNKIFHNF